MSKLVRAERLERYRRRLRHERSRLGQLEPARPRVANEGCHRVVGHRLVRNVDAGVLGDVLYPDAGVSLHPILEPVPRHLWPVHRATALPAALEPDSTPAQLSSPAPQPRPRRCRRTHRPARARAPDGPSDPAQHDAPAHHVRGIGTTFDQPEAQLRDRSLHRPR